MNRLWTATVNGRVRFGQPFFRDSVTTAFAFIDEQGRRGVIEYEKDADISLTEVRIVPIDAQVVGDGDVVIKGVTAEEIVKLLECSRASIIRSYYQHGTLEYVGICKAIIDQLTSSATTDRLSPDLFKCPRPACKSYFLTRTDAETQADKVHAPLSSAATQGDCDCDPRGLFHKLGCDKGIHTRLAKAATQEGGGGMCCTCYPDRCVPQDNSRHEYCDAHKPAPTVTIEPMEAREIVEILREWSLQDTDMEITSRKGEAQAHNDKVFRLADSLESQLTPPRMDEPKGYTRLVRANEKGFLVRPRWQKNIANDLWNSDDGDTNVKWSDLENPTRLEERE